MGHVVDPELGLLTFLCGGLMHIPWDFELGFLRMETNNLPKNSYGF